MVSSVVLRHSELVLEPMLWICMAKVVVDWRCNVQRKTYYLGREKRM